MKQSRLFCYATEIINLGAGLTVIPAININNESDFLLVEVRATQQAAGAILTQFSMASGELFSNTPLDTALFSGTAYPVRLPEPVVLPANAQINVQLTNTTGGALSTQIQFWGYRITNL